MPDDARTPAKQGPVLKPAPGRRAAPPEVPLLAPISGRRGRARIKYVGFGVVLIALAAWGGKEIAQRWTHVYESDARIAGELITVSSRVAGWVTMINVTEGDQIKRDSVLVQIDPRESELHVKQLKAQRATIQAERTRLEAERQLVDEQTTSRASTQVSQLKAAQAVVASIEAQLNLSQSELKRAQSLFKRKVASRRQLDVAQAAVTRGSADLQRAAAQLQAAHAKLQEARAERVRLSVIDGQFAILDNQENELAAQIERQQLDLNDRTIRSPVNGVVDRTFVETGEYVTPGQRLAMVHDPTKIWVEANIKETEVSRLQIGQRAEISVDAYPDLVVEGVISRIGNSTTSEFALLPSPNPSGNFTKITQRLPIRIKVSQSEQRLRPGMMVEVSISTSANSP